MEERRDRRQIDRIEKKMDKVCFIINGNGRLGLAGKVDIVWGYRNSFVGLFSVNIIALIGLAVFFHDKF